MKHSNSIYRWALLLTGLITLSLPACGKSNIKSEKNAPPSVAASMPSLQVPVKPTPTPQPTVSKIIPHKQSTSRLPMRQHLIAKKPKTLHAQATVQPMPTLAINSSSTAKKAKSSSWLWIILLLILLIILGIWYYLHNQHHKNLPPGNFKSNPPLGGGLSPISGFTGNPKKFQSKNSRHHFWKKLFH